MLFRIYMNKKLITISTVFLLVISMSVAVSAQNGDEAFQTILEQAIAENLLLDKELYVSHIIKEETFQLDLKEIEIGLQNAFVSNFDGDENINCEFLPVMFMTSKKDYRYGKLEEIDALLDKLEIIIGDSSTRAAYGINGGQFSDFKAAKSTALDQGSRRRRPASQRGQAVLSRTADP